MRDVPLVAVALTVCAYWLWVGRMVWRVRRREHRDVGIVPERHLACVVCREIRECSRFRAKLDER